MDKLTAIKIKRQDGSYTDEIPIGALAQNIDWDSNYDLVDIIGNINMTTKGSLQSQIDSLNQNKITYQDMTTYVDPISQAVSSKIDYNTMTQYVDTSTGSLQSQITNLETNKITYQQMTTYVDALDADDLSYDNTTSGLVATDVQDALDELSERESLPAEELTQSQYNALPESQKMADKLYFITDTTYGTYAEDIDYDNTNSGLVATDVQGAIDQVQGTIDEIIEEDANDVIYIKNQSVSILTGDIATISDSRITSDHVLVSAVWSNPSAITSDVTWSTDTPGKVILNGTCAAQTSVNVVLVR